MRTRSQVTTRMGTRITTTGQEHGRATIRHMPRRARTFQEDDDTKTLADVVRRYDRIEKQLAEVGVELKAAVVVMGRRVMSGTTDMTMTEIANRVGWTREYVSRVVADANKADGWSAPPKPAKTNR